MSPRIGRYGEIRWLRFSHKFRESVSLSLADLNAPSFGIVPGGKFDRLSVSQRDDEWIVAETFVTRKKLYRVHSHSMKVRESSSTILRHFARAASAVSNSPAVQRASLIHVTEIVVNQNAVLCDRWRRGHAEIPPAEAPSIDFDFIGQRSIGHVLRIWLRFAEGPGNSD